MSGGNVVQPKRKRHTKWTHHRLRAQARGQCLSLYSGDPCLSSTLLPISKHRPSHEPSQEVFPAGRGTTYSKAVTRCRSACTGQALGRWRRRRSLYCLTCVAILKRVTMIVAGWACASAVRYGVKWRSVRHGGGDTQPTRAAT